MGNPEYGPAEPYRYRNTLGGPWGPPDGIDYRWFPPMPAASSWPVRTWRAIVSGLYAGMDVLTGQR